jgi:hypothetical protein
MLLFNSNWMYYMLYFFLENFKLYLFRMLQVSLVIRDLTLRVFAITRFRGKKAVRKFYSNFAVTVYGGDVIVWRAHQLVTSYQYQCEREC